MEHQTFTMATREQWFNELAGWLAPDFEALDAPLPERIRFAQGFTSQGKRGRRLGECWSDDASADKTFEIFIHPQVSDSMKAAGIAAHELIHAAVGLECGHKGPFKRVALGLGLEGKMTSTEEGPRFIEAVTPFIEKFGELPHAALNSATNGKKKQGTRLIKVECAVCGFNARITQKWLDDVGAPLCPVHGVMDVA